MKSLRTGCQDSFIVRIVETDWHISIHSRKTYDSNQAFRCSRYHNKYHSCTGHYIKASTIEMLIYQATKRVSQYVLKDEKEFVEQLKAQYELQCEKDNTDDKKELLEAKRRMMDLEERNAEYNRRHTARRKELMEALRARAEAGDQEAQSQLAERKQYQVRATVKSYRKMRDDALSGDPIAKVRYEKTLAMRREAYHAKKSEQTA